MGKRIERRANTTDEAIIGSGITLNTSTSVKIADANADRLFFDVNNDDASQGFWVKLQAASVDDDKKGIFITSKTGARPFWCMPVDNIYTGEISAIAVAATPTAYITEY